MPTPLSERAAAPETVHEPTHPEVTWRAATAADVETVLALYRAAGAVDHPYFVVPRHEVTGKFSSSTVDPARDTMMAITPSGDVVAAGSATLGAGRATEVQTFIAGTVHPNWRGRGLGRELARWQVDRARQQLAGVDSDLPGSIGNFTEDHQDDVLALMARFGLQTRRYFTEMEWHGGHVPDVAVPDDVRIVPFTRELSEATRHARNDAFRDHWGSQPTHEERWSQNLVDNEHFRPDLSRVVVEKAAGGPRVLAFAMASVDEENWAVRGWRVAYVDLIGVRRERRGQRLAPAVMAAQMRAVRDAGLDGTILDVDTENPTGALGLYERMGYTPAHRGRALLLEI
ncbi:GNAT family N-acetyltransferase [Georgenia deserti]|uniref:GNAT family N-acetyltransferase n=1 Tax=Georgenia deserti TaxID=2093781 RepID=A0ABW4L559_9MICO